LSATASMVSIWIMAVKSLEVVKWLLAPVETGG